MAKSNPRKGAKFNSKGGKDYDKYPRKDRSQSVDCHINDPSWIDHNPELTKAAGSINFATRIGVPYALGNDYGKYYQAAPTLMNIVYTTGCGVSKDMTSAINISANMLSSTMRRTISGSRSYMPVDVMLYIYAIGNIHAMLHLGHKVYQTSQWYTPWNPTLPDSVIEHCGFVPAEIRDRGIEFWDRLNKAYLKISTLAIPAGLPFIDRQLSLADAVVKDREDTRYAQLYNFVPANYFTFEEQISGTPGMLKSHDWYVPDTSRSMDEYFDIIDTMIAKVVNSESCWIIDGDIRKCFDSLLIINLPSQLSGMEPKYTKEFASQIENLIAVGNVFGDSGDIKQDVNSGALIYDPIVFNNARGLKMDRILNMHYEPTPLETCYALQFTAIPSKEDNTLIDGSYASTFDALPLCFVNYLELVFTNAVGKEQKLYTTSFRPITNTLASYRNAFQAECALSAYDWHPTIYYMDGTSSSNTYIGSNAELDVWTVVNANTLKQVHDAAILSYFGVPR